MNIINKLSVASAFAFAFAATSSFANTGLTSGEIIIKGTVGEICEIGVVDLGASLDLVNGVQGARVGEITETCNNPQGYAVELSSANGSYMEGPLGAVSNYTVNYDSLSASSLESVRRLERDEPRWNQAYDLTVNVTGDDELPAGNYTDTVTVTIAAL